MKECHEILHLIFSCIYICISVLACVKPNLTTFTIPLINQPSKSFIVTLNYNPSLMLYGYILAIGKNTLYWVFRFFESSDSRFSYTVDVSLSNIVPS